MRRSRNQFQRGGLGGNYPNLSPGISIPPGGFPVNVLRNPNPPPAADPFFFDINNIQAEHYSGSYNPTNNRSANARGRNNHNTGNRRNSSGTRSHDIDGERHQNNGNRRNRNRSTDDNQSNNTGRSNDAGGSNRGRCNYNQGRGNFRNNGHFHLGFKKIEEIKNKEPEEILIELLTHKDQLKKLFAEEITVDTIVILVALFSKMCATQYMNNLHELLLVIVCEDFMQKLEFYVLRLPLQNDRNRNRHFWNDINGFFKNLIFFCHKVADYIPNSAADFVPSLVKSTHYTIGNLEQTNSILIHDDTKSGLEEVQLKLATYLSKEEEKKKKKLYQEDEDEPPNDFHEVSIYPSSQEITTAHRDYLRRNKVEGSYRDVSEYLDIQFRLLREDFVAPLRDGICAYLEKDPNDRKFQQSSIKIYENVSVVATEISGNQLGFLIQVFTPNKKMRMNIENSKRFMFGSLLCFTTDNFNTIIFGKVINRKKEQLAVGQIVAGFESGIRLANDVFYKMAECKVYFEPYYHVLKALQSIDIEDFPLKKYLVDVDIDFGIEKPGYVNEETIYTIGIRRIAVADNADWPRDASTLRLPLNQSQYNAYKVALSTKFSVIQGPPGTGKTYLGLKVAHTLLQNQGAWATLGPMLIVCFTNHALDQFLEGILKETQSIVRIGGQSRDENLSQYNIKNLRFNEKKRGNNVVREKMAAIKIKCNELVKANKILKICNEYKSILSFEHFLLSVPHFEDSWFNTASEEEILNWLLEDFSQNRNKQTEQNTIAPKEYKSSANDDEEVEEEIEDYINDNNKERFGLDIDDDFLANLNCDIEELINMEKLLKNIHFLQNNMASKKVNSQDYFDAIEKCNLYEGKYDYFKMRLNWLKDTPATQPQFVDYNNPYRMPFNDRWLLYNSWLQIYKPQLMERIRNLDDEYRVYCKEYNEVKDIQDIQLMRNRRVIGMTTTGAARLQTALQVLKCPIVIVEEAAEVLEAHIVTALSSNCQHLILIGDHKQLRPATADYHVDKDYKLGISLFERMVKNQFPCCTLNEQHRMRPEISSLITPAIYEHLEDHQSVMENVRIKGVTVPLYFINHENAEKEASDSSKENYHEAIYILKLARYLVLNNVDPNKITIIAAYAGQLFLMLRERKQYERLRDVKIVVLDNYQGEENDIILLSLVRNNQNDAIGFLSLENRVCVALSRAKHAMYIMGNINMLCRKSAIWPKIRSRLEDMRAIGSALELCCENHNETTAVQTIDDFQKVAEGGCMKICDSLLECGHKCNMLCHMSPHVRCFQPCLKTICEFDHPCYNKCYQQCSDCMVPKLVKLKCGHELDIPCHMNKDDVLCPIIVSAELPCDHVADKQCHEDDNEVNCPHPCDARIEPCGHACTMRCHIRNDPDHLKYECRKDCERRNAGCMNQEDPTHKCKRMCFQDCQPCNIIIQKGRIACAHFYKVACHIDPNEIECMKPCKRMMACGHNCKRPCNAECGGCVVKVTKVIESCGHSIKINCCEEPTRQMCKEKCISTLFCGHPCKLKCSKKCDSTLCIQLVDTPLRSPCGHYVKVPCNISKNSNITEKLLTYCQEKCTQKLQCDHQCAGTCSECYQGKMHKSCQQKCKKILVCSHECTFNCNTMCQPCPLNCTYRCVHSKCKQKCGIPCTQCKERCTRRCAHQVCTKLCFEMCNVRPCDEPCPIVLKCGHDCIGYCGDPCPPLCRICDNEEVTETFFGDEDEEDTRFVYLEECKHTLDGVKLEKWFQTNFNEGTVGMMECPKCKQRITLTQRFSEYIKRSYKDIEVVKKRHYGIPKNVKIDQQNLLERAMELHIKVTDQMRGITLASEVAITFINNLSPVKKNRRQTADQQFLKIYTSKFEIFEHICNAYIKHKLTQIDAQTMANQYINSLLNWMKNQDVYITNQEINDYTKELGRLTRIMQLCKILNDAVHAKTFLEFKLCEEILFSFRPYMNDDSVKLQLDILVQKTKNGLNITETERLEILKAVNLSQGHWYKCPRGHIYAIGECGGAMELGKCPECGAAIGGERHHLVTGNAVATEMDGARHSAYSELMNLANFNRRDYE